jgi:hypothetical protein
MSPKELGQSRRRFEVGQYGLSELDGDIGNIANTIYEQ